MNTVQSLLSQCRRLGAEFRTTPEGQLQVRAQDPLPDQLQQALKQRKAEVIALLLEQNNTRPRPYLDDNGGLIIPLDAHTKYRWWAEGQSVRDTLRELNAPPDVMARYVEESLTVQQ